MNKKSYCFVDCIRSIELEEREREREIGWYRERKRETTKVERVAGCRHGNSGEKRTRRKLAIFRRSLKRK